MRLADQECAVASGEVESLWQCDCLECGALRADAGCGVCGAEEADWRPRLNRAIEDSGLDLDVVPRCDECLHEAWDDLRAVEGGVL